MADPVIQPGPYALGHSQQELDRLVFQGRFIGDLTAHVLRLAGLGSGMRVLDVGSGAGDVAMVAADIVGPGGHVVGIDRDAAGLELARHRADQQGCGRWITFTASQLDAFASEEPFDAIVGRFILMYQPDAAATLRSSTPKARGHDGDAHLVGHLRVNDRADHDRDAEVIARIKLMILDSLGCAIYGTALESSQILLQSRHCLNRPLL